MQLALGALAFAVFNFWRTKGDTIFIGRFLADAHRLRPLAVIALASIIGLALWAIMLGALNALSWITGLAATAPARPASSASAWVCITELTKKGAEHVITPEGV